jgi:hypothetical protein
MPMNNDIIKAGFRITCARVLTRIMLGREHMCFKVSAGMKTMHVENKNKWPLTPDENASSDEEEALLYNMCHQ